MSNWETTKKVLWQVSPLTGLIAEVGEKSIKLISNASDAGIEQLKEEVAKQKLQMQFAQEQAKVAQELAIAKRIDNAKEVMIEEFYENTGKGNLGLSIDQKSQTGTLGLGGEGTRVVKRIYHFKGFLQENDTVIQDIDR